ncbi:MAG: hypothetical protein GY853_01555 [PVC group bacterium]|nr:hypothetical protein [PVC group bacterium]
MEQTKLIVIASTVIVYLISIAVWATFLKAVIIGSDFDFHYWIKFGKRYRKWYGERETFEDYLLKNTKEVKR